MRIADAIDFAALADFGIGGKCAGQRGQFAIQARRHHQRFHFARVATSG